VPERQEQPEPTREKHEGRRGKSDGVENDHRVGSRPQTSGNGAGGGFIIRMGDST
jgi:hypothetical protein